MTKNSPTCNTGQYVQRVNDYLNDKAKNDSDLDKYVVKIECLADVVNSVTWVNSQNGAKVAECTGTVCPSNAYMKSKVKVRTTFEWWEK